MPTSPIPASGKATGLLCPGRLVGTVLALLLGGCGVPRGEMPVVLYLAVDVGESQLTGETAASAQQRFSLLLRDFRGLHPNVVTQVTLYSQDRLNREIGQETRSGLGPDLILTDAANAKTLLQASLVDPLPPDPALRRDSDAALLQRVRNPAGQLAGQPLLLFPQLACFDRRRVPAPAKTLTELLALSAAGTRVGLPIQGAQLLWIAGAFGAIPGLHQAAGGGVPNQEQRQAIQNWLGWLQAANSQQRVNFFPRRHSLRDGLQRGDLDWITCNSSELDLLRRGMGSHLGVAPLPDGPIHPPSPINELQVLALGTNSSRLQRQKALELIRFSASALEQRSLTLQSLGFLPGNPHVNVPVQSSAALSAMGISRRQGAPIDRLAWDVTMRDPRLKVLERQVIVPVVFSQMDPPTAVDRTIAILREAR